MVKQTTHRIYGETDDPQYLWWNRQPTVYMVKQTTHSVHGKNLRPTVYTVKQTIHSIYGVQTTHSIYGETDGPQYIMWNRRPTVYMVKQTTHSIYGKTDIGMINTDTIEDRHVTSTNFDETKLYNMLYKSNIMLSIYCDTRNHCVVKTLLTYMTSFTQTK